MVVKQSPCLPKENKSAYVLNGTAENTHRAFEEVSLYRMVKST